MQDSSVAMFLLGKEAILKAGEFTAVIQMAKEIKIFSKISCRNKE